MAAAVVKRKKYQRNVGRRSKTLAGVARGLRFSMRDFEDAKRSLRKGRR